MVARNRLPPWHDELRLGNGRTVLIRPIRPDDVVPLLAGFDLLQPETIRRRLLSSATQSQLAPLTRPDPRSEFVLVAAEPEPAGTAVIDGVGRIRISPDARSAEFVVLIGPHILDLGVDSQLLLKLVRWSRSRNLEMIHGLVDRQNRAIVKLSESLGFTQEPGKEPGTTRLVLKIPAEPQIANG